MTDVTKYRNVSLSNETYKGGHLLSTKMFKGLQVSMSQLIDALVSEKIKDTSDKLDQKRIDISDTCMRYDGSQQSMHGAQG